VFCAPAEERAGRERGEGGAFLPPPPPRRPNISRHPPRGARGGGGCGGGGGPRPPPVEGLLHVDTDEPVAGQLGSLDRNGPGRSEDKKPLAISEAAAHDDQVSAAVLGEFDHHRHRPALLVTGWTGNRVVLP